ncbi:MAG: hypothetical protein ABSB49_10840 [Polyangia bacterium]|jgi:hypothetical protein
MTSPFLVGILLALLGAGGCDVLHESTTACTLGSGASQTCVEVSVNVSVASTITTARSDCTSNGGVVTNACVTAGADGGCKTTSTEAGITVTTTVWFYSGVPATVATETANCSQNGGTWVTP